MTSAERKEHIQRIRALPRLITSVVEGLNDAQLDTPYRMGGWTPRQVVHHLADSHLNAFIRMKLILTEDKPRLKTYEQDEWAKLPDGKTSPISSSLSILSGLHERWTLLLEGLSDEQWSRPAIHPDSGEVTMDSLSRTYALHGEKHAGQISGLRKAQGW